MIQSLMKNPRPSLLFIRAQLPSVFLLCQLNLKSDFTPSAYIPEYQIFTEDPIVLTLVGESDSNSDRSQFF